MAGNSNSGRPRIRFNCKRCNVKLNPSNQSWMQGGRSINPYCKECQRAIAKANYYKRRTEILQGKVLKNFGVTVEKYNEMFEFQQGGCAICRQPPQEGKNLAVDHNHETNEFRGLLCIHCNLALGLLKEDEDLIFNMMEYLKRTTWNREVA